MDVEETDLVEMGMSTIERRRFLRAARPGLMVVESFDDWLAKNNFLKYSDAFKAAGVMNVSDLVDIVEADIEGMGMTSIERRRFMRVRPQ